MGNFKFQLGDKVKDKITGLQGTVTSRYDSLTGPNRYDVETDKPSETWFDEGRLELVCVEDAAFEK